MLLYRSMVVGLLGAIALLISLLPQELAYLRERHSDPPARAEVPMAIVNVSKAALDRSGQTVAGVIGLAPGEQVVRADGELAADHFIDVLVSDGVSMRQVLVLVRN